MNKFLNNNIIARITAKLIPLIFSGGIKAFKNNAKHVCLSELVFYLINKKGKGLEIGPSHRPYAPKKNGFNVEILDHADENELKEKYKNHGVNLENIEKVDYVWKGEPLHLLIGEENRYDWIIASNVIEHIPDLVSFLQQCERLLKKDGILSLVIPDKRVCFDYFSPVSTTGNLLDAYYSKNTNPSKGQVFDHHANASKRFEMISWAFDGKGGPDALVHNFEYAKEKLNQAIIGNDYIDVHCWRFIPELFNLIMEDLLKLDLIGLSVLYTHDTVGSEFFVSIGRKLEGKERKRFDILQQIHKDQIN